MSAYFQIKARPKSNFSGKPLTITTNCRSSYIFQCFDDLVVSYKEMEPLTQKILDKGRETARENISDLRETIAREEEAIKTLEKIASAAQSREAFQNAYEQIEDARNVIKDCADDIKGFEAVIVDIGTFEDMLWYNDKDWEFWVGIEAWVPGTDLEEDD